MSKNELKIEEEVIDTRYGEPSPQLQQVMDLLDKTDLKGLEKFNVVVSTYIKRQRSLIDTITFRLVGRKILEINYLNSKRILSDGTIVDVGPADTHLGDRFRIELDHKDFSASTRLNELNKDQGGEKAPNYAGTEKLEQFHKPLLGKLYNQFQDQINRGSKYNPDAINLRFENFNFVGGPFIIMSVLKWFTDNGRTEAGRSNNKKFDIKLVYLDEPTFRIEFTIPVPQAFKIPPEPEVKKKVEEKEEEPIAVGSRLNT